MGQMSAGKTTLGRLLAGRLQRPFLDSDVAIEARRGLTGAELSAQSGVGALHRMEREVLVEALGSETPSVIAAAASVVDHDETRERLRSHWCVWLTAPEDMLRERWSEGDHRRSIGSEESAEMGRRGSLFRELADLRVDTGTTTVSEAAEQILDAFRLRFSQG